MRKVAEMAKVSHQYASKVMDETDKYGGVIDPKDLRQAKKDEKEGYEGVGCRSLTAVHEYYLLSLHASNPARPISNYISELYQAFGIVVSKQLISEWFKSRFYFKGSFRKVNKVPKDKFKPSNRNKYWQFMSTRSMVTNPFIWNFVDEKHFLNGDAVPDKVRVNPLTGELAYIPVSGNFREAHNMMACISCNPFKERPMAYTMGEFNGDASSFLTFIQWLITIKQIRHNEILVMDNARIHNGGEASIIEDMLWDMVVDGRPLNVYILWLPTRRYGQLEGITSSDFVARANPTVLIAISKEIPPVYRQRGKIILTSPTQTPDSAQRFFISQFFRRHDDSTASNHKSYLGRHSKGLKIWWAEFRCEDAIQRWDNTTFGLHIRNPETYPESGNSFIRNSGDSGATLQTNNCNITISQSILANVILFKSITNVCINLNIFVVKMQTICAERLDTIMVCCLTQ